jgi:hypothetical protein
MKNTIAILFLVSSTLVAFSQENMLTLSGGYTFANIEEADADGTGWRINGLYEYIPGGGKVAHGISFGYVSLSAEGTFGQEKTQYDVGTWPIYYAPKYLIGDGKMKGFIKGAIGWQFSSIDSSRPLVGVETSDSGFTAGAGAGFMFSVSEKIFLNAEYEFLWLQNSYFRDGYLNTASLGLGLKF